MGWMRLGNLPVTFFSLRRTITSIQMLTGTSSDVNYKGEGYLAPSDVNYKGQGWDMLIAEKIGNVGYAFNRTVWRKIHSRVKEYWSFNAYNWDITMWATVYPSVRAPVYTLRGPRTNEAPFGKCGCTKDKGRAAHALTMGKQIYC